MVRSVRHDMLPKPTHDEKARQEFVVSFRQFLGREIRPTNRRVFERRVVPAFASQHDRVPATAVEIRAAMYRDPSYLGWCAFNRAAQELMWNALADSIDRELPRLRRRALELMKAPNRRGSLHLDADFVPPKDVTTVDIHLQPGGYTWDGGDNDVTAGAFYESGGNLYAFGQGIRRNDSKAAAVQAFIRERYPDLRPCRILDMGCSAGSATVPYAAAFPDAEVHGIDVGSGMLRYAHARAEALGQCVHFHQMSAAATTFPDAHFDLIVSHNLLHEVSHRTLLEVMRESYRLLAPGGVCVHQDVPLRFANLSQYERFEYSWDTKNNNEPFWEAYANADVAGALLRAGFAAADVYEGQLAAASGSLPWFVATAVRR